MLKTCIAASILAVFAMALPARAQTQQERDDKACAEQGAGPGTDGYSACLALRKMDRFQRAQRSLAAMEAMGSRGYPSGGTDSQNGGGAAMKTGPLPPDLMYLMPKETRALEGVPPPQAQLSVTTTKVCSTEGDAAKSNGDATNAQSNGDAANAQPKSDAADPPANCQTTTEVSKKMVQPPHRDPRNDPTSATARTYMHPGDIFNDHTQLTGP